MALIIFYGALAIAPILLATAFFYVFLSAIRGEPLSAGDWVAASFFLVLPAILVLAGLASLRGLKKKIERSDILRLIYILLIVSFAAGIIGGVLLGSWFASDRVRVMESHDRNNCQRLFGTSEIPEGCVELARSCRKGPLDLAEAEFPGGSPPPGVWPADVDVPSSQQTRAEMLCIHRRQEEINKRSSPVQPILHDPTRFACRADSDCVNSCRYGAVSGSWYRRVLEEPWFSECHDGCNNQVSAPPRCDANLCVAYQRDPRESSRITRRDSCTGIQP